MTKSDSINDAKGYISAIYGSLIEIKGFENQVRVHDLIKISDHNILGEILQIYSNHVIAQCFESTNNLKLNEVVINTHEPLSMELSPGLLTHIFDGVQRPLELAFNDSKSDGFLERGFYLPPLSRTKKWHFIPQVKVNSNIKYGDVIGTVQETPSIVHKIMVPPEISGKLSYIVSEGDYTIIDTIYRIKSNGKLKDYSMLQRWPITKSRPYIKRLVPSEPLITGLRVVDLLFPIAKGGSVAVPGGFGTGKTVIQQSLAKWCNADIIIFVGCGERGNEIADVLKQFSELKDPRTGRSLIERIFMIANTSNMPVSAREASIFSGVTIGEYYREMGYDVAVLADSTSRWAESLREISGLLEEMPAEGGYPSYLASKLSSFYERAGVVQTFGKDLSGKEKIGSLTIIASVSPPAGDFSEPVTATTKRFVQAFWALDANLAYSKHYPAINWLTSYSNYPEYISDWWYERDIDWLDIDIDWYGIRNQVNEILSKENELKNITQLIGKENLPEDQRLILFIAKLIRDSFLMQNAFDDIDNFTGVKKLLGHIKLIILLFKEVSKLLKNDIIIEYVKDLEIINKILRIGNTIPNDKFDRISNLKEELKKSLDNLKYSLEVSK
ncbi:MAG: V-type ATP synthase subunit A [Candidatus Thorarchaeota archaeon]